MMETPLSPDTAGSRWISTLPSRQASRTQQSAGNQLFSERSARRTDWAVVAYALRTLSCQLFHVLPNVSWTTRHSPWQLGDDAYSE